MSENRQVLNWLFKTNQIDLKRGKLFGKSPSPMPRGFDFERVEGMMLGLAVGDAFGASSEGKLPGERKRRYGEIRDYLPNKHTGKKLGYPTDDTQLAFWSLEQMLEDGRFVPENVASRFCREKIFGIGKTVKGFVRNYKSGKPWYQSGPKRASNGALMRIAPMLIPYLKTGSSELWVDTALSAMMTHNDSTSTSACLAFIDILWQLLKMKSPPKPEWWVDTYVETTKDLEINDQKTPRTGAYLDYKGPLWKFIKEKVWSTYKQGIPVAYACNSWGSGAFLYETVPSCLYILMKHSDNPEEAIIRAVNDTKDNDTIAAIVGAAVGALHGKNSLPQRWIKNLTGRTTTKDDGKVFEILKLAKEAWWR